MRVYDTGSWCTSNTQSDNCIRRCSMYFLKDPTINVNLLSWWHKSQIRKNIAFRVLECQQPGGVLMTQLTLCKNRQQLISSNHSQNYRAFLDKKTIRRHQNQNNSQRRASQSSMQPSIDCTHRAWCTISPWPLVCVPSCCQYTTHHKLMYFTHSLYEEHRHFNVISARPQSLIGQTDDVIKRV